MRLLVVEDDTDLALAIHDLLASDAEVDVVATVHEGIEAALTHAYDCLVIDVMLPDGDGFECVDELRQCGCTTPILMLTVQNDVGNRVKGLTLGADDYMGKPFEPAELVARIHALVRRGRIQPEMDIIACGSAALHRKTRTVQRGTKMIELSSKEFMLMDYLLRHAGQVLSRDILISHVWGPDALVADNALDTYIYFLRQKCGGIGLRTLIKTIRGEGYMLNIPD